MKKLLKLNIQLFASASNSATVYAPASSQYPYVISVNFNETGTNVSNNTSQISISGSLYGKNINYEGGTNDTKLSIYWIDNNENSGGTLVATLAVPNTTLGGTYTVSGSISPSHKADGTLNGYARVIFNKATGNSYIPPTTTVDTANTVLTTIPRATATPSVNANVGVPYTITLNPASNTFKHTIRYTLGSLTNQTIATNVTNSYTWTMPNSFYAQIGTTATSKTGTLYVDTYSGSSLVGTTSATFTANTIESQARPNVTISSVVDTNSTTTALTGSSSKIVLNASTAKVTYSVSSPSSANITKITVNGTSVSTSSTNYSVTKPSSGTFTVVATDSRGYTRTATYTVASGNIVNYVPLSITSANVKRTADVTSNRATLTINGNYSGVNFGTTSNTLTLQYKEGSGSWTNLTPTISDTTYSNTTNLTNVDYTQTYTYQIKVTDKVNTSGITSTITLKRGTPIFWCDGESFNVEVTFNNRSLESRKKNFEDFDLNAIDVVKNGNIYKFNYDVEKDTDMKHYGFVIPDKGGKFIVPEEVLSQDKSSVELYAMSSILWEAMKEMIRKNEQLEKEIKNLKESEK